MREKLLDLMKNEGLKPSQLAETLGINPAGISHILAGRNKPGFDLLQKILRRFPRINPDWLLLDAPQMYREQITGNPTQSQSAVLENEPTGGLFGQPATEPGRPGNLPDIGYGTSGKSANAHGAAGRKKSGRLGDANRPVLRRPDLRKLYAREDDEIIFPGQSPEYRRHEAIKYDKEARSRRIRSTVITRPDTRKIAYKGK